MKVPPPLPEVPDWLPPDQRAEVWPRPLTRHQRQAAVYRASKNRDRPWPKSWRREPVEVTFTNGRTLVLDLLAFHVGYVMPRPLSWVEHDRQHEAMFGGRNPWVLNDPRSYLLNPSWWAGVRTCRCGAYVLDDRPDGVVSFLRRNELERAEAYAAEVGRAAVDEVAEVVEFPAGGRAAVGER